MNINPFAPRFEDLPDALPIFPLGGVLLLPDGLLPLNIFEKRYLSMIEDAMAGGRLIGMVQPKDPDAEKITDISAVFKTGCAGKIIEFSETTDGRYEVKLSGICRFDIAAETEIKNGYRIIRPDWSPYKGDFAQSHSLGINRDQLKTLLQKYFENEGMTCDWGKVDDVPDGKLMTCLSMVCPFDAGEKQALLEAECGNARARMFMTMLEMAVCGGKDCKSRH